MNIEIVDKWLDEEYGVSYTRLEELHDFVVEKSMKEEDKLIKEIDRLNNIINELEKILLEKINAIKTIKITLGEDGANVVTPNINLFEKEYRYFLDKIKELKENNNETKEEY